MDKTIRAAVIGVGYLGKFHAEKYAAMEHVDLVGVVDIDAEQAGAVAEKLGTTAFTDYHDLMGKVDAVSVVVHTPAHFAVSRAFLENDVDVLIEKPMTTDLVEADALIAIAGERDRIIQVGHLERFNPAVVALQDIIKQPRFIESHRLSVYKPRCTDVSVVLDLMIHDIDIILNFVNADVKEIHAAGIQVVSQEADIANARIEFTNGCVANVTASRISTRNERKIRIFQQDGYMSVDFANHAVTLVRPAAAGSNELVPGTDIQTLSLDSGDALNDEIRSFVHAVRHRTTPEVTGKMGRDALGIALDVMAQISKTSGQFGEKS